MSADHDRVLDSALRAVENNDAEALASVYAPDIRIWHSHDGKVKVREENLAGLASLHLLGTLKYHVLERVHSGQRIAQRHELVITAKDASREYRVKAAIFFTVRDGMIAAFDEYMDSRQLEIIGAAIQKAAGSLHGRGDT